MTSIKDSLLTLFNEVFDGAAEGADGTWFVQSGEALVATLGMLSAEQASRRLGPEVNSIAAHVSHTAYYLELSLAQARGSDDQGDWPGSWKQQEVSAQEWDALRARLLAAKSELAEMLARGAFQEPGEVAWAVANIGHAAYHLGAIRQLFLLVNG